LIYFEKNRFISFTKIGQMAAYNANLKNLFHVDLLTKETIRFSSRISGIL